LGLSTLPLPWWERTEERGISYHPPLKSPPIKGGVKVSNPISNLQSLITILDLGSFYMEHGTSSFLFPLSYINIVFSWSKNTILIRPDTSDTKVG